MYFLRSPRCPLADFDSQSYLVESRDWVVEGVLAVKVENSPEKSKERFCFLCNDMIIFTKVGDTHECEEEEFEGEDVLWRY